MAIRPFAVLALVALASSPAAAQTMRFTTNVGSFDMVLNPGDDPNLQPLVDNIVAYIGLGRYHFSALNRAADGNPGTADDFVLQMGGFMGFPNTPELWASLLTSVEALDPVVTDGNGDGLVDFNTISNTRGTVSLALQAGNPNSGTSSFFINLGNNGSLDSQGFVPFAEIRDMTTIDRIMALNQRDLSSAAGQPGSLAFIDVPIAEDGRIVVVKAISVIESPADFSFVGPIASVLQQEAASAASVAASQASLESSTISASAVPEPSTVALGALGASAALMMRLRRRRQAGR
jgi:cyclophilin family peptidyl-prolyl cis-trans isomerase